MSTKARRGRPGARGYPLCAHCGELRRNAPRGRFCSDVCRQRAFRRRRQGLPESLAPQGSFGGYSMLDRAGRRAGGGRYSGDLRAWENGDLIRREVADAADLQRYGSTAGRQGRR